MEQNICRCAREVTHLMRTDILQPVQGNIQIIQTPDIDPSLCCFLMCLSQSAHAVLPAVVALTFAALVSDVGTDDVALTLGDAEGAEVISYRTVVASGIVAPVGPMAGDGVFPLAGVDALLDRLDARGLHVMSAGSRALHLPYAQQAPVAKP
jgi:hypothetical protein